MKYKKIIIIVFVILLISLIAFNRYLSTDITSIYNDGKACIILNEKCISPLIDRSVLEDLATVNFDASFQRKVGGSKIVNFDGVLLKSILMEYKIDFDKIRSLEVLSADNYKVEISKEELLHDDNVYFVYKQDGEYLLSLKSDGTGPFMIVFKEDELSTRWSKFVVSIEVISK